jgi:hypothetical protein
VCFHVKNIFWRLQFIQHIAGLEKAREAYNILTRKNFSEMSTERTKMLSSRQQPRSPWSDLIVFLRFNVVGKKGHVTEGTSIAVCGLLFGNCTFEIQALSLGSLAAFCCYSHLRKKKKTCDMKRIYCKWVSTWWQWSVNLCKNRK